MSFSLIVIPILRDQQTTGPPKRQVSFAKRFARFFLSRLALPSILFDMAKKLPEIRMKNYGIYHHWDSGSPDVPKIKSFTQAVPARIGIEFGYVLELKGARGMKITFEIDHPPFRGDDGNISPPFTGEQYVRTTPYLFYLGDTIWAPEEDKIGVWTLTTWLDGREIASKKFTIDADSLNNST